MWSIITHILCFAAGMVVGVILMCLMQAAKQADEQIESIPIENEI